MTQHHLHEVPPALRSGVALDAITTARRQHAKEHRRPAALTAREALLALQFEALLVWTVAANMRAGVELADEDFERLTVAVTRLDLICDEVLT